MKSDPDWHIRLHHEMPHLHEKLSNLYLSSSEIVELDEFASIAVHGMTHRDLRYHLNQSEEEIRSSKKRLKSLLGHDLTVFCYPEGESNPSLHRYCRESGFTIGLSIRHEAKNDFCVGRYCMNRHFEEFRGY